MVVVPDLEPSIAGAGDQQRWTFARPENRARLVARKGPLKRCPALRRRLHRPSRGHCHQPGGKHERPEMRLESAHEPLIGAPAWG